MDQFETYKNNIDLNDKHCLSDVLIEKGVIYNSEVCIISDKSNNNDESKKERNLAAAVVGLKNTASPLPNEEEFNAWSDIDAQELYLNSKPTCYLILSKPGAGAYSLGEALSKKLNCIHICPQNLIIDELDQQSITGKCLDYNMKHSKKVPYHIILRLLHVKITSPAVFHRGYVISGFPLVTNSKNEQYLKEKLNGEAAFEEVNDLLFDIICNLKKKLKKEKPTSTSTSVSKLEIGEEEGIVEEEEETPEEMPEEEEEIKVELPKFILNTASNIIHPEKAHYVTRKAVMLQQLEDIFNLEMKPDYILYLTCPDKDMITRKSHKYMNYKTSNQVFEPYIEKTLSELCWPAKYTASDYQSPFDSHTFNPKYNCKHPIDFKDESVQLMCNYKNDVLPYIEKKLKEYEPKHIIRLDARQTTHQIMHNVTQRLQFLPIKPVLIPQPLYIDEPPEEYEEFWKSIEEMNGINDGVLSFKRHPSAWFNRCPVELKYGRSVLGKPKLAVAFLKHIYLLSSLDALISFCRNPRPYLKLKFLEPTCRVIITGTKSSGKTMVSECLSWLFDVPIICYKTFFKQEAQKKYNMYAKNILMEIYGTIEDKRLSKWESAEIERISMLESWCKMVMVNLNKYINVYIQYLDYCAKVDARLQEINEAKLREEEEIPLEEEINEVLINDYESCRQELFYLPILDDLELCKKALDTKVLSQYAPNEIKTPHKKPTTPILGEDDVTEAIESYINANDLRTEIEPTVEELMNELKRQIIAIDSEYERATNGEQKYGKFIIDGFPTDPDFWGYLIEFKILPDYTIALIENRELDDTLVEYYNDIEKYPKNHHERFIYADDPLLKTKMQSKSPVVPKETVVKNIINDMINDSFKSLHSNNVDIGNIKDAAMLTEAIEKCKEDLDTLKIKLEENFKCYIDVELENKTDVQVIEEVQKKLRKGYFLTFEVSEEEGEDFEDEDNEVVKDMTAYNNPTKLCESNIYCPIGYFDYGVLWEGKPEFSLTYDNKLYRFCKEETLQIFQDDVNKYLSYNMPFKKLPPLRICVIGAIGTGKTTISKLIAKELGLLCVDFSEFINDYLIPKHFGKVGRNYENPFQDTPIDDEAVVEFQMGEENENLISDILSNESELKRMVYNYFEHGSQILPPLMQKLIRKLWFQEPFVSTGFILDGYPRLPSDVEDMVANFCIPDLVIELEGSSENSLERLSGKMFKTWKTQLTEAKEKARKKLELRKKEWSNLVTKHVVVKLIVDEILDNNLFSSNVEPTIVSPTGSIMMYSHQSATSTMDINIFKYFNEMKEEYPEPVDETEWPKADEIRENIDARIESIYETDDENIQSLKEILSEQRIKVVTVNGTKPLNKLTRIVLSVLKNYRNRSQSLFEQTFVIKPDIAEVLISSGFYLLSKFNRMCPVNIYENTDVIQNAYSIHKNRGDVYPVGHRAYIYFVCGKENVIKFRTDPLKYIVSSNIRNFIEYPLRISVIGPPKSGKSSLAAKIAKKYGLLCISKGIAIRHTLENLHWTEVASLINTSICVGECADTYNVMEAVRIIAFDHRVSTYGYVFDGFPESASEAMELCRNGLYPNIIFNFSCDSKTILDNSQNEIYFNILKYKPPYSSPLIEQRFLKWKETQYNVRDWINNDYQNIYNLNGNDSKWQCLQNAFNIIDKYIPDVHNYLVNVQNNVVHAAVMGISNEMFEKRMSNFKNMCPVCLSKNILKHSKYPVDRQGLVQYQNKFYWICAEHLDMVLKSPQRYLKDENVIIPEIPAVVKHIHKDLVYENGVCIVTYAENLPSQKIVRGSNKHAASFKGRTYMFCSEECLTKFLAKPHMYADITVFKEMTCFREINLKKLPNIGYLEQTVGNIITQACCSVNVLRPKYPGLDFGVSALLYIALYLKTHNPLINKSHLPPYIKALRVFEARCKLINDVGLFLRSMDNPFAKYPKCCSMIGGSGTMKRESSSKSSSSKISVLNLNARRVPVPDQRYDFLCEYHKPVSKVPAFLNVVDIAGLVRGAAEGQGLGNAFLSHIKACDAIFNLCRAFDDEDVIHVDGDVNPVRDLETIGEELRLKDEEQLLTNIEKLDRVVNRGGEKKLKPEYDSLMKIKTVLVDEKKHIRFGDWSAADIEVLNKYLFLTSKPALYLVNLSEKDYIRKKNKWLPKLKEWIDKNDPGAPLIPFSGVLETKLLDMDAEERQAFLKEHNITSALDKIIVQGYKALQLEYFFTAGPDEVKAWTIQKGTKAPQAAGRIHTDFEKGFIMAEVMHFKDFKEEGSEAACKAAGKYRQQGRNYVVEDGDIIFFKFNAGAGLKDAKKK